MRAAFHLFFIVFLFLGAKSYSHPLTLNLNRSPLRILPLSTGETIVAGQFTSMGVQEARHFAALSNFADLVDSPAFDGVVRCIVEDPLEAGAFYVGGRFEHVRGEPVAPGLVRFTAAGLLDRNFMSQILGFDGEVRVVLPLPNGKIYVGGDFRSFNGDLQNRALVRLNSNGTQDKTFSVGHEDSPSFDGEIYALAWQPSEIDPGGFLYVGGDFSSFKGIDNLGNFARLRSDGSLDADFSKGGGFNSTVMAIEPDPLKPKHIYVGGFFSSYKAERTSPRLVRLNEKGVIDKSFNTGPGFNGDVLTLAVDKKHRVYVGGRFSAYNTTKNVQRMVRIKENGDIDTQFISGLKGKVGFDGSVDKIYLSKKNPENIYVGGSFSTYNGIFRMGGFARLNLDGGLDKSYNTHGGFDDAFSAPTVFAIVELSQAEKILVGGQFRAYGSRVELGRMLSLGPDHLPQLNKKYLFNDSVLAVSEVPGSSGSLYVGGSFISYKEDRNLGRIVRLNPDGSRDNGFFSGKGESAGFNNTVYSIVPTEDAKVYVGGAFTTYNSAPHLNSIVRLEKDGGIDTSFKMGEGPKAGFNGIVMAMAVGKSGLLYVGGNFSRYKGKKVSNFVRLFPNGSLDESYTKGFDGDVKTILISKEGLVYVGGDFSNYLSQGRQSAKRLARLTQSGQLDERFFIGKGFNATVNEINYSKTKDLIVVGAFSTYNGKKVPSRFVRLNVLGHMLDTFSADFSQDGVQGEIKGFAELKTNGESLYLFGGEFTKVNGKNRFGTFSVTEDGKLLD